MKGHLYLIGFMGVGKSAVSRKLSGALAIPCMDTDSEIEGRTGKRIAEIFETEGEEAFREMETALLRDLTQEDPKVVSCGGGLTLREENRRMMKESGTVCYLMARPETVLSRVQHSNARPLLNGHMELSYIAKLMEERKSRYEHVADLSVATDGKTVEEVAAEIQRKLAH
ncbi:MAG: shikimate kinase [Lachnospiraceae bacterium]|nr:shikimate kinase [Lachnospiraceae bacterium]